MSTEEDKDGSEARLDYWRERQAEEWVRSKIRFPDKEQEWYLNILEKPVVAFVYFCRSCLDIFTPRLM